MTQPWKGVSLIWEGPIAYRVFLAISINFHKPMSVQYIFSIAGVFAVAHIAASILSILTVHWIQNHYTMSTLPALSPFSPPSCTRKVGCPTCSTRRRQRQWPSRQSKPSRSDTGSYCSVWWMGYRCRFCFILIHRLCYVSYGSINHLELDS